MDSFRNMTEYLSQDIDLLDFLRTKLGDLSGFATLANEFIQNAEDAKASQITFDVTDESLMIQNDSQFSEDDFRRMQKIAGGDRRADEWTIGKFGIGFTSVYLITDRPQLISSGKHWIFSPEKTAENRIEQRKTKPLEGTRFLLPWAKENSLIRQKFNLVPITDELINEFIVEVQEALPKALLFLRNLQQITLRVNNEFVTRVCREYDNGRILIRFIDSQGVTTEQQGWYLLEGDFSLYATLIRNQYGENNIPVRRRTSVTVAIPEQDQNLQGLLYAFLPTQQETDLPFHINADFFPSSDRKRISLDNDYRGVWNNIAWQTAISVVANNLDYLKYRLGHCYLWKILSQGKREPDFWKAIKSQLPNASLIWTTNQQWRNPQEVFLLKEFEQERNSLPLLQEMGLSIVHSDLKIYSSLLNSIDVGVPFLDALSLANFLICSELNRSITIEEAPQWIRSENNRNLLGFELDILLTRKKRISYNLDQITSKVAQCAISLGHDGKLHPINNLYCTNSQITIQLFSDLNAPIVFLANNNPSIIKKVINDYNLTKTFTADAAIATLENIPLSTLKVQLQKPNMLPRLFQLLDDNYKLFNKENIKERLCRLPIFPSSDQLLPLTDLLVPSSFNDPLHLASLVDLEAIGGHREFLINLGAKELTLLNYVREQVPSALQQQLEPQVKRQLIYLLANHLKEFINDNLVKSELSKCLLVECHDGEFRIPNQVYLETRPVIGIFGNKYPIAFVSEDGTRLIKHFLQWLGVENQPRPTHLLREIQELVQQPSFEQNRQKIREIFLHINQRWSEDHRSLSSDLQELKTIRWLPGQREQYRLYSPNDIFTSENSVLFFTQAKFLDISPKTQLNLDFLEFLSIKKEPSSEQVVNHLLTCSNRRIGISYDVYKFLQEHLDEIDSESLNQLREGRSLYLGQQHYVYPSQVFWNYFHFEPYRFCLNLNLRPFTELFRQLNVHEYPDSQDAISVLEEIGDKYARQEQSVSEEDRKIVIKCWVILAKGLENQEINQAIIAEKLQNKRVVLTDKNILKMPHEVFFKDRPNLADKFPIFQDSLLTKLKLINQYKILEAAGVRRFSQVVKIELIDKDNLQVIANENLYSRIRDRKYLIKRVVIENRLVDNFLNHFFINQAEIIRLCYSLNLDLCLEQQTEKAVTYLEKIENQFILYYSLQNGAIPWAHIAREIAYALDLDAETGQVASALKEVISAEFPKAASEILDALGFAPGTESPTNITASSQLAEIKEKSIVSSDIEKAPNIVTTDPGTSAKEIAIEIGRWAKEEAKDFYSKQLHYVINASTESGFDFLGNCQGLPEIKVQVKAITFNRPNIRLSITQWTAMVENQDSYELLIISHNHQNIQEMIRIRKAWNTLVDALSQLKVQEPTSAFYDTENIEVLIGFQQNSDRNSNDVLLNWRRLIKVLPQENVIKYSHKKASESA